MGLVGLLAQKFAWLKGAKRVIAVDYVGYRLEHAKRTNHVEIVNFESEENIGNHLKEITGGGADVVLDCVGMSGKMTPMEFLASGLKAQGGAMAASSSLRKRCARAARFRSPAYMAAVTMPSLLGTFSKGT